MVEVTARLEDNGQLAISIGGQPVSPIVLVGLLGAAKHLIVSRKPEEAPKVIPAAGDEAIAFGRKVHA